VDVTVQLLVPCSCHARIVSEVWDDIAGWWVDAVRDDPGQSVDTHDLLAELCAPTTGSVLDPLTLDLGCGEGQGMRVLNDAVTGGVVIGVDVSARLLDHATIVGPVVRACLPDLSWVRSSSVDRIVSVGLLDLVADHEMFFAETARVVCPGGHLAVVINHPVMTSPHSAPLVDPDGEILWRWGTYLMAGTLPHRIIGHVDDHLVTLHHRPLGELLSAAAAAGWSLDVMVERGPSVTTFDEQAGDHGHDQIPALAGFRWRRDL
jgi:SAM-dependent methyltransferase